EQVRSRERSTVEAHASEPVNDLERAALTVAPALARWRDALGGITGCRPRLAGSGATWFIEGDPASCGVEDRPYLVVGDERAPLVCVRTLPPEPPE
ncbi:MAG TPA: hypothetical protein VED63_05895, partial [Acidimicrobiales bacterium]|nr:hypothetical protein [Acidimicrobiales bacterium]